jgi:hypothetical protein
MLQVCSIDPPAALSGEQYVCHLKTPQGRHQRALVTHPVYSSIRRRRFLVAKAPSEGKRSVNNEHAQYLRPSSLNFFHDNPPKVVPSRNFLSCATASAARVADPLSMRTSLATGLPRLVMTICSPRSTRCYSAENLVLASKEPIVAIMRAPLITN